MFKLYKSEKEIYKIYESANHVYRKMDLKDSGMNKIFEEQKFIPTDLDINFLKRTQNLIEITKEEVI